MRVAQRVLETACARGRARRRRCRASSGPHSQRPRATQRIPWCLQISAHGVQRPGCGECPAPHALSSFGRFLCAQNERVLFHYNGHGVPRPTANGEVWVFNKSYTQYIPMSIYDLQTWVGAPCICVFDCSAAGLIVNSFRSFAEQRQQVRVLRNYI